MENISNTTDRAMQMFSDGLRTNVGETTGQLNNPLERAYAGNPCPQSIAEQKPLLDCLTNNPQWQKRLTSLLLICFDTLDTFGKEPEQLQNLQKSFQLILGRFHIDQVEKAFQIYMERHTVMPKPADIVKIIEPPKQERKWCGATFIDIKTRSRQGQFITDKEKQYCEDFIQAKITAPEEENGLIEDAIKQVQLEDKRYWSDYD